MKSKLLFVSLMTFFLATMLSFGQAQKMPRFWEFIANSPNVSGVSTAAQWMRNNFDEFNIPLISYRQAIYTPFSGVDSIFKHNAIVSQVRGFTWIDNTNILTNNVDMVSIYFPGYLYYHGGTQFSNGQPLFQTGAQAPGFFQIAKKAIDDAEAENGDFACYTNVSVTSKFENGSIKGTVKMQCFDEYDASYCTIILAEGYHKYGTQDFYFIPRKMMNSDENMTGSFVSNLEQPKTVSFDFPVDKDWNPKYLYVIALAEVPNPLFEIPALFGAGVDRVVDVKTASSAVPVSLDISVNNPNDKFKRIDSDVNIVYKITNSGSKAVKALVYIDKNTSIVPDGWTATANKDTVTLQPGGNTTVQVKLSVIGTIGTAAVDVCVLPLETGSNENPLITHAMAVASTNDQRIIAFVDGETETNSVEANSYISPYKEQMTILPWQYYSAIPADAFEGYMFVKTSSVIRGTMTVMNGGNTYRQIPGNFVANMSDNDKLAMSNYLVEPELQYINSVLQKGKHTALLIDKSCAYSAQADANTQAEYTKLFNSFGVKYIGETELVYDNGFTGNKFELKSESGSAVATDPGTQQLIPNFMCHDYNYGGAGMYFRFSPYLTKFDITSPGKTTKAFTNGGEMVGAQALNGNQKLFILGTSPIGFPLVQPWPLGQIFSNLHQWWFGYIKKLNPEIYIAENTYDMDVVEVGSGVVMTKKIVIENRATNPEDTLKISSITWTNNEDASFVVTEYPDNDILPGKKDTLIVQFDPKNPISYTNVTLEIKSNDQQVPVYRLIFSGVGEGAGQQGPHLEVDAGDMFHDFGSKEENSGADLWDLILYNGGTTQLNISSIKLSDATDKDVFKLGDINFNSIAKWDIKTISLTFSPTKKGFYDGAIVIKSDCYENPTLQIEFIAEVTGTGVNEDVAMMFTATLTPNPTAEFVNINFNVLGELSRNVKINLVDASGKSIAEIDDAIYAPGSHSKQINLKGITNGTYFIEYIVDGKRVVSTLKILK